MRLCQSVPRGSCGRATPATGALTSAVTGGRSNMAWVIVEVAVWASLETQAKAKAAGTQLSCQGDARRRSSAPVPRVLQSR